MFSKAKALRKQNADLIDSIADYRQEVVRLQRRDAEFAASERALRNQVDFLIREIRKMDDIIFSIQQSADGTWTTVRDRFTTLCDQMTARKVAESNRISDLIVGELHNTYKPPEAPTPKQIGSK